VIDRKKKRGWNSLDFIVSPSSKTRVLPRDSHLSTSRQPPIASPCINLPGDSLRASPGSMGTNPATGWTNSEWPLDYQDRGGCQWLDSKGGGCGACRLRKSRCIMRQDAKMCIICASVNQKNALLFKVRKGGNGPCSLLLR
jgi:hypothetical protein